MATGGEEMPLLAGNEKETLLLAGNRDALNADSGAPQGLVGVSSWAGGPAESDSSVMYIFSVMMSEIRKNN